MSLRRAAHTVVSQSTRAATLFTPCPSCPCFSAIARTYDPPCGQCLYVLHDNLSVRESIRNFLRHLTASGLKNENRSQRLPPTWLRTPPRHGRRGDCDACDGSCTAPGCVR